MRWLIVKVINLLIVLVAVTFIVAALTSGPMAQIQIDQYKQGLQQAVKNIPGLTPKERQEWVQEKLQEYITSQGLNKPWYYLAVKYTWQLLKFEDLNATTMTTQYWHQGSRKVLYIIGERIPFSIMLFTTSSVLTLIFALPLALYAARRPGGKVDNTIVTWSVFSVSMPWWWLAMVFIYLFAYKWHIFAGPGAQTNWKDPVDVLNRMALPVLTVTLLSIGDSAFRMRNILLDTFNEDFVTVARAKGVPERMVLMKHVLRAAAPPIVTIVLFSLVLSVVNGAIITELVFNWFGMGRLYWDAIEKNDVPVLVELTYITTLLYLLTRFALDILYTYLDPRIRRA